MSLHYDVLIKNAIIIDGTNSDRFESDVAVRGDRVVKIGDLTGSSADLEISADGLVLAPGFIDAHTHDDRFMLSNGDMTPKVSQGVTTIIGGNCGISLAPMPCAIPSPVTPPLDLLDETGTWFQYKSFADYVEALRMQPPATNCAMLVGHTTMRVAILDDLSQPANEVQINAMRELAEQSLEAGAIGISSGLAYPPAVASLTEEIIEVCQPLQSHDGIYCTHMRDEGDDVIDSLNESFRVAREVGVPVVISHHKVEGVKNHGRSRETLGLIEKYMETQPISLDCYPYTASSTVLNLEFANTARRTVITWSKPLPQYSGWDLTDVEKDLGCSRQEAVRLLLPAGAIYHQMSESDVQKILSFGPTMIGSDGLPHDKRPHPRLWGTFPRVLGHYSRDLGLFRMETAIHKMTGLTARNFGLLERGVIKEGAYADLTLLDPSTVNEGATFEDPVSLSAGIKTVIVNGSIVWDEGRASGQRPGRFLKREVR